MSDTLLHAPWTLRDVPDVEALCRGVLREMSLGLARPLEWADRDESIGFLLGEAYIQECKWVTRGFDRRPGYVFRAWLYQQLCSRLIDHWRSWRGRNGEKVVFDERLADSGDGERDGAPPLDRPDQVAAQGAADDGGLRAFPRAWTDLEGDRGTLRPVGRLGVRQGAGGPRRDRRAGAGTRRGAARTAASSRVGALDCVEHGFEHLANNGVAGWVYARRCATCNAPLPERTAVAA